MKLRFLFEDDAGNSLISNEQGGLLFNGDPVAALEAMGGAVAQQYDYGEGTSHYPSSIGDILSMLHEYTENYNPNQPRDKLGRWTKVAGGVATGKVGKGVRKIANETTVKPPKGSRVYNPKVHSDKNRDGVTDAARVGVPAMSSPPPPRIGRLPNLTRRERAVETAFVKAYERAPDKMAGDLRMIIAKNTKPGEAMTFGTDDAKSLTTAWSHVDPQIRSQNRATLNNALHQVANAVTKRAFLHHLDTLKKGDEVMVTVGGCGAGKGYALKNVPEALAMKQRAQAVWDSAGDQNATENPWIQREAEKRGLKVNYVYVHADPFTQWAHPERGVVKRAADPSDGRMVDAQVFADSYAIGARNHAAFQRRNSNNPNATFLILENSGTPKRLDALPHSATTIDRTELANFAVKTVQEGNAPKHVKRGALSGLRIWKG